MEKYDQMYPFCDASIHSLGDMIQLFIFARMEICILCWEGTEQGWAQGFQSTNC